jgi:hypothetical protein
VALIRAVRSHNVPRISKSYESFGNRFTTTVIDDIATSDFSEAVKGLCRVATVSYLRKLNDISGVDAIIHVASPLPNSSTPQVILDVRDDHAKVQAHVLLLT